MKKRSIGYLSTKFIDHESEAFDYIGELHEYLWRVVRSQFPWASGNLEHYIDVVVEKLEKEVNREKL